VSDIILNAPRSNDGRANSPWPMFRHDLNHTGRSQYDTSKNNGQKKWDFATGGWVTSSPAIGSDGTIYVGSWNHKLYALYPNGTKKWDFVTGDIVRSSPAIGSDGTIYVGSDDYKLYALYPNGTKKWDFATGGNISSSPAIGSDGTIYVGSDDNKLYALYPNGAKKWDFATMWWVYSSPAIGSDGTIYVGSDDGNLYSIFPNGTKKWNFTGGGVDSSPAIGSDGTIYIGSGQLGDYLYTNLYALFPNGTKKWNFNTGGEVASSPAIGSDGTIYVGSSLYDCKLFALYPNGTKKWDFATGSVYSSPAIGSDGTIYVGSDDGKLYAINPNGTKKWDFATGSVYSSPAIGSNGTIYIGSLDGRLYAIGTSNPTAPQDLKAIGGNAQVALIWKAPRFDGASAITNYTIYRETYSGSETFLVKIGNVHTYQDNSVTNGQKYFYKVTANNTFGESPRSNEANATPATTPTAPEDLAAAPGNTQIALSWKAPADNGGFSITNYTVYRNDTRLTVLGNVRTYTDSGLVNGVTYTYNVSALNIIGEGPKSIGVIAIPGTIPTAPRGLHATPGNAQIALTWMAPASNGGASISNYSIYRGTASGFESLFVNGYSGGTSWVDTNITVGKIYYYTVSAVNAAGEGPRSNETNATPYKVPSAPTLTATAGISKVTLSWTIPSSNGALIANYSVYRGTTPGTETIFIKGHTGGASWVDTNITVGTTYYYMVGAVNAAGEGPRSNEQNATPYAVPSAPTLTATAGILKVMLSWTVPSSNGLSITNYSIYRGTTPGGEILFVKGHTGGTSWVDTNITVGTTYYYMVSAVNAAGEGPRSNERTATPGNIPNVPSGLTASGGNTQVTLRWSAPMGGGNPAHYDIYRSESLTGTYTLIASPTATRYNDTGLTNGHKYWYKINAQNSFGVSENTTAISAMPHATSIISAGLFLLGLIVVIIVVLIIFEATRLSRKKKA